MQSAPQFSKANIAFDDVPIDARISRVFSLLAFQCEGRKASSPGVAVLSSSSYWRAFLRSSGVSTVVLAILLGIYQASGKVALALVGLILGEVHRLIDCQ